LHHVGTYRIHGSMDACPCLTTFFGTAHTILSGTVPKKEVKQGQAYIEQCMRYVPTWCKGMPLDCESGFDKTYGGCE